MPVPRWLAQINKRVFNKLELRRGVRPLLTHVGRTSGTTYRTPLDAHPVDSGFLFIVNYTSKSDWVKNVLAAGKAHLEIRGDEWDLVSPRLITREEAAQIASADVNLQPGRIKGLEYLLMEIA